MSELAEYELPDGTTLQLSEEDAKNYPGAKKVGPVAAPKKPPEHEPVHNRARH